MISSAMMEIFQQYVPEENIHLEEPMASRTTFRVGGPAECLIEIDSPVSLGKLLRYLEQVEYPFTVMGNGSNLLVGDKGYQGVILHIGKKMSNIRVDGNKIHAQAGATMGQVAAEALKNSLT